MDFVPDVQSLEGGHLCMYGPFPDVSEELCGRSLKLRESTHSLSVTKLGNFFDIWAILKCLGQNFCCHAQNIDSNSEEISRIFNPVYQIYHWKQISCEN